MARVLNFLWPRMGWRRYGYFMRHRLGRMKGTPYSIAAGFACGAAASMTPLFGLHILLSVSLAWLMRASLLSAALGTLVGNPWTFPVILYWSYEVGWLILDPAGPKNALGHVTLAALRDNPIATLEPVFWPMIVGSIPLAIVVWCITYWPLYTVIDRYKSQRLERRHRRALELMQRMKAEADHPAPDSKE